VTDITVIGAGYVGLVTGVCLAELGHSVTCLEIDPHRLAVLRRGESPIHEPGLEPLMRHNCERGRLDFTDDYPLAIARASIVFLAVPTPAGPDGHADTSFVFAAVRTLLPYVQTNAIIVTKTFYGAIKDPPSGETWLVLEYLTEGMRVSKMPHPDAMSMAASWIGRFHATGEARLLDLPGALLRTYDIDYYLGWARRTLLFADAFRSPFPWLSRVCDGYENRVADLLTARPVVVHGEFTPHNILMSGGAIFPVDWESAAMGAGEIDLAILTDSWPEVLTGQCELEYERARWPGGTPSSFRETLMTARLYCQFRWLGARPEWTTDQRSLWRFAQLRSLGEALGLC
jgi:hypothetical protein